MMLRNKEWDFGIEIDGVTALVMEDNLRMRKLIWNLCLQTEGEEGSLCLFADGSEIKIEKNVFYISDPGSLKPNDKRILAKFYEELKFDAMSMWEGEYLSISSELQRFIIRLLDNADINSRLNDGFELESLFRMLGVGFLEKANSEDMLEYISRNIQLVDKYIQPKMIVTNGFQVYFNEEEWSIFCSELQLRNIRLLDIEFGSSYRNQYQKVYTIDKDGCFF